MPCGLYTLCFNSYDQNFKCCVFKSVNYLPRDREGHGGSKTTYKKLSSRRIHWCGDPSYIFIFWQLFLKKWQKKTHGWIAHQMHIRTTLAFVLLRSGFKFETSFGIPSPNHTGQSTCFFVKPQNVLFAFFCKRFYLHSFFSGFRGGLGTALAIWSQIDVLVSQTCITSTILDRWILFLKK